MARVFEDFVRNFYRTSQRAFVVKPLQLAWQAMPIAVTADVQLPTMRTDVYLESPERRIILDTKYYAEALQERQGPPASVLRTCTSSLPIFGMMPWRTPRL